MFEIRRFSIADLKEMCKQLEGSERFLSKIVSKDEKKKANIHEHYDAQIEVTKISRCDDYLIILVFYLPNFKGILEVQSVDSSSSMNTFFLFLHTRK